MGADMNEFLKYLDKPIAGAMSAVEDAAGQLMAMGYTQISFGADATGSLHVLKKGNVTVRLVVAVTEDES